MPTVPTRTYDFVVGVDTQIRVCIYTLNGETCMFAVALEYELSGKFQQLVGIDTAHGRTHRHVFRRDGSQRGEPVPMPHSDDLDLALRWSVQHLAERYQEYVDEFLAD